MADFPEIGGKLSLDTSDFSKSVKQLKLEISNYRAEAKNTIATLEDGQNSVNGLKTQLDTLGKVLDKQKTIVSKYRKAYEDLVKTKGKDDEETQKKYNRLLEEEASYSNTVLAINKYTKALKEAQEKEKYGIASLEKLSGKVGEFSPRLGTLIAKLANWKTLIASIVATIGIASVKAIEEGIKAFIEYESAFTNIRKTVDGTERDFETLNAEIEQMAKTMPKTTSEIANIAALGGQLGIAVNDLSEFTQTMLMLGDATTLTADQAGEMIAHIANITDMPSSDFERFGSALVALGNNFATTESKTLEMTQRITRFSKSIGLSIQEVLGLSTALSSMGIEADAGGTAIQKIFTQIQLAVETGNSELQKFAETAGMTSEEFQKLWKASSIKGFQSFINGMKNLNKQGQTVVVTLDKLGINEVRLTSVLQALTGDTDTLATALSMSNTAWDENIALTEEATRKYATLASQQEITANKWSLLSKAIGENFAPLAKSATLLSGDFATALLNIVNPANKSETAIASIKDALDDYSKSASTATAQSEAVAIQMASAVKNTLTANIKEVSDSYNDITNAISKQERKIENYKKQIESISDISLPSYGKDVLDNARAIDASITTLEGALKLVNKINSGEAITGDVTAARIEKLRKSAETYRGYIENLNAGIASSETKITTAAAKASESVVAYGKAVKQGLIDIDFIRVYNKDFAVEIEKWIKTYDRALQSAKQNITIIKAEAEAYATDAEKINYYSAVLERLEKLLEGADVGSGYYTSLSLQITEVTELQKALNDAMSKTGSAGEDAIDKLELKYSTLSGYINAYGTEAQKINEKIKDLQLDITKIIVKQSKYSPNSQEWKDYSEMLKLAQKGLSDLNDELVKLADEDADEFVKKYSSSIEDINSAINAAETELANLYTALENGLEADSFSRSYDVIMAVYDKLIAKRNELLQSVDSFTADSILSQYGTDAEKTAIKIKALDAQIEQLKSDMSQSTSLEAQHEYSKAIATLSRYRDELKASGKEAGKTWFEAFAEEMTGGSESYQNSLFSKWIKTFQNSFGKLAEYVGDYWGQITEVITSNFEYQLTEVDAKLQKLEKDLENREAEINRGQTERQNQLKDMKEAGAISELAYYKASAKASQDAEKKKQQAQEETEKKRKELQRKQNELKKKQFEAEQANSIAQAIINGALAAVRCYSDLGPIAGTIAAVTVAGITAAQVVNMSKQKYVPALAEGGITTGPTYAMIGDNPSGREAVIPLESKTMQLLADKIVESINRPNNSVVYNNDSNTDGRSYTINQTITPPSGMTKREAYLQARKALKETSKY